MEHRNDMKVDEMETLLKEASSPNKKMTLYYVTGYSHHNNEWWRFTLTAPSSEVALEIIRDYNDRLSRVSATAICETSDDVFVAL
jgi:hypothetical protein